MPPAQLPALLDGGCKVPDGALAPTSPPLAANILLARDGTAKIAGGPWWSQLPTHGRPPPCPPPTMLIPPPIHAPNYTHTNTDVGMAKILQRDYVTGVVGTLAWRVWRAGGYPGLGAEATPHGRGTLPAGNRLRVPERPCAPPSPLLLHLPHAGPPLRCCGAPNALRNRTSTGGGGGGGQAVCWTARPGGMQGVTGNCH